MRVYFKDIFNLNFLVPKTPEPECRVDQDCPSQMACIAERCQNPCRVANPCTGSQQCLVTDTLPTRTVACVCPQGFVSGSNGECKQVEVRAECYDDTDCRVTEVCNQGDCMDACRQKRCGNNAKCEHTVHDARCECISGFTGDPYSECYPRKY